MKQTAVEWLVEQLKEYGFVDIKDTEKYIIKIPDWVLTEKVEQAKQIDMEQKIDCFNQGYTQCSIEDLKPTSRERFLDAEDYINKTFKSE